MATEKRLLDANDVKELINGLSELPWEEEVDYLVDGLPTVDAVEVVRCKDCRHYVLQACACRHENFNGIIHLNGYCSYGERKDND